MSPIETEEVVSICILRSEGRATSAQTLELAKKLAEDIGIRAVIEDALIGTQEQADN